MGKDEPYDPCRQCTDRAVCRGECARAAPYINERRRELRERMAARRKKSEETDCRVGPEALLAMTGEKGVRA